MILFDSLLERPRQPRRSPSVPSAAFSTASLCNFTAPAAARTSRIDVRFQDPVERMLRCDLNAERLARRIFWVVSIDEMTNRQVQWTTRDDYIAPVTASWPEYNRFHAHPFDWSRTSNRKRRRFDPQVT